MDSFREAYRNELDNLTLGPEQKERLVASLEHVFVDSPMQSRRQRIWCRLPLLKVAAVLLVLTLGGGAVYGWATGDIDEALNLVNRVFPGSSASVEVVDGVGRVLGSEVSASGMAVRAEAVLGDGYNVVVIISLTRDGGWGDLALDGGGSRLPFAFEGGGQLVIEGVSTVAGGAFFFDEDVNDDVIHYVLSATTDGSPHGSIRGHEARVTLHDLSVVKSDGVRETISPGSWELCFPIDYGDMGMELPVGKRITLESGATATVEKVAVSPVGIAVTLSADDGRVLPGDYRMPMSVVLSDGTVVEPISTPMLKSAEGSTSSVLVGGIFDRLVDLGKVDSVIVGDISIGGVE